MIIRYILEAVLQISGIVLLTLLLLRERTKKNYFRIFLVTLVFIIYQLVLALPHIIKQFDFIKSEWNWDGKILGIIFGILCYFIFKKYFIPNNFFTLKQNPEKIKLTSIVSISVMAVICLLYYFFIGKEKFDNETLLFQLTAPALDEEIMFRGILLGLLLTALPAKVSFFGNPAILLNGILFGLIHALSLSKDYKLDFDMVYFIHTGIGGYVFAWLALKSRSILLPILTHGFTNFFASLITMLK